MAKQLFDSDLAHDKSTATYAPMSDAGNRPPKVHWVVETGSSVMVASPPGARIRAEAESMNSSRVTMRDARPDHGHAHIADVTVWASGPEPLTEETIAVASAIYWSWWRALDMHGEAP
jgi:hypothetical protein